MIASLAAALLALGAAHDGPHSVDPGAEAAVPIAAEAGRDRTLAVVVAIDRPGRLRPGLPVEAALVLDDARLEKTLHPGDPDATWTVRLPAGRSARVVLRADAGHAGPIPFVFRTAGLGEPDPDGVAFEVEPNDSPDSAQPIRLGQTVYGLADDRPFLPLGESTAAAERAAGRDLFRFTYDGDGPALAFFALEFTGRDVPPDVRVYALRGGEPVEYTRGIDPQAARRELPPRPGANKFTTRVIEPGEYLIEVDACHPDYQLRTGLYRVPPYLEGDDPGPEAVADAARVAIRTAMDFQLLAGDSWHANTPRRGHPTDRVANAHHETSTCVGCHPTHFTMQSALEAVANGYTVKQPFAAQFLAERLANNPVPLHGHEGVVWARMIPAPANVLGRLSTILDDFETRVAAEPNDNLHRSIAEFLKLYYDGRAAIPPDESNGNNPVSRYKVAADAWRQLDATARRTGEARFGETRDLVARLLADGEPSNTRDLAAQTIGLVRADREGNAERIAANVERLLSLQRPDGHWSVKFDPDYPIAEMQTGESLYALALAGLPADHPAVRKGVVALLRSQDEFGGWLDPNPYEQFRTPFRETQWALMALSRLYPAEGPNPGRGWHDPLGPRREALRSGSPSALVADLERIWDAPSNATLAEIVAALDHPAPHVRLAACAAIGRVGDRRALTALVARLGDESKPVGLAASEAVRRVGNRFNAAHVAGETLDQVALVAAIEAALESPDDRTRRGAVRVFSAHFRALSQEHDLADALLERLETDPDPAVRMGAVKGLWRWWYWQDDPALRGRIEDALLAALDRPEHPWVRRNLTEALYILADENIRYLDNHWLPSLPDESDRERATAAHRATADRLGAKFARVLAQGDAHQREGVLRALTEFGERPAVTTGRVGNDIEPPLFYESARPALAAALVAAMGDPDPAIRRLALQATNTLRGHRDPALARAVLARLGDAEAPVRDWAATMAKEFPLDVEPGRDDPRTRALVAELSASPRPEARVAALELLARRGPAEGDGRPSALIAGLDDEAPAVRAAALGALAGFDALLGEPEGRRRVVAGLADADPSARVAALRLALDRRGPAADRALRAALEEDDPAHRSALLGAIAGSKAYAADLRLVGVVSAALLDADRGVRERALQAIQAHPGLVANPAVEDALRELTGSDNARQVEIAASLLKSRGRSSGSGEAGEVLDRAYFEARVLPILAEEAEDGQSCVGCHRSHTILRLVGPDPAAGWTAERVRANYRAALRVVDLVDPAASLLLNKPTREAAEEAEAQNDPSIQAHAGGVRFEPGSPEHRALLDWINGARLKPPTDGAGTR